MVSIWGIKAKQAYAKKTCIRLLFILHQPPIVLNCLGWKLLYGYPASGRLLLRRKPYEIQSDHWKARYHRAWCRRQDCRDSVLSHRPCHKTGFFEIHENLKAYKPKDITPTADENGVSNEEPESARELRRFTDYLAEQVDTAFGAGTAELIRIRWSSTLFCVLLSEFSLNISKAAIPQLKMKYRGFWLIIRCIVHSIFQKASASLPAWLPPCNISAVGANWVCLFADVSSSV